MTPNALTRPAPAIEVIDAPERAASMLDPLRLRILEQLRETGTAADVARALGLPRQRVHYHVRELERAGLIELIEERRRGNFVERRVRAKARAWLISPGALGDLGAGPADVQDRFSSSYLLALAARTIRDVAGLREGADAAGKQLATFAIETEVRFPTPAAQHAFAEDLANAVADVVARHHDAHSPGGRTFRLHVTAYPGPARAVTVPPSEETAPARRGGRSRT